MEDYGKQDMMMAVKLQHNNEVFLHDEPHQHGGGAQSFREYLSLHHQELK
jgi:hypothetical protein